MDLKTGIYAFRKNQGLGINIAVIDSGCHEIENSPEFAGIRIMQNEIAIADNEENVYEHGTKVTAMIFGKTVGISRYASLYCIRGGGAASNGKTGFVQRLMDLYEKISKKPEERWIINWSKGTDTISNRQLLPDVLKNILNLDNVVIVSAGGNKPSDGAVCLARSYTLGPVPVNLLTVGQYGILNNMNYNFNGRSNNANVYAPGIEITTYSTVLRSQVIGSGSSYASPLTAGMISNLWSQNKQLTAKEVVSKFLKNCEVAYNASPDNDKRVVDPIKFPAGQEPDVKKKSGWDGINWEEKKIN